MSFLWMSLATAQMAVQRYCALPTLRAARMWVHGSDSEIIFYYVSSHWLRNVYHQVDHFVTIYWFRQSAHERLRYFSFIRPPESKILPTHIQAKMLLNTLNKIRPPGTANMHWSVHLKQHMQEEHFPHFWPFVRGIHLTPEEFPLTEPAMFRLLLVWTE